MSWLGEMNTKRPDLRAKRALDVCVSLAGLSFGAPLLATLGLAEFVFHGWPPVFVQSRPGFRGRVFQIVKLRTMTNERGEDGELLPDADRMTAFGRFLRSTSLDEVPELWNVLRGEMSLVGPRPLLVQYLDRYTPEQKRRHDMPPGVTGLAQVMGRNALSWEEKFSYDLEYVDDWSLMLDLKILTRTASAVIRREGIAAQGAATMPVFVGEAS